MNMRWMDVLVVVVVAVLLLWVEHWGPWQDLVRKRFHQLVNYVLGVLALILPLTVLLVRWQVWEVVGALWAVVVAGGLAVMLAYWVDATIAARKARRAAEQEVKVLMGAVDDQRPESD